MLNKEIGKLIPIENRDGQQAVNARHLYVWLEVKRDFQDWIKRQFVRCDLVENQDYEVFYNDVGNPLGGRPSTDYALSLNAAKEISMMSQTEKGKQARRYFIDCERKLIQSTTTPTLPQNYKQALQQLLASVEQNEKLQLENNELQQDVKDKQQEIEQQRATIVLQGQELKESAPKAEYYDTVLQSKNTYTSTVVAKELGLRHAEQLHRELQKRDILFHACGQWVLTAKYCQRDLTRTRTHTYVRNDGSQGTNTITVWTEAGRVFLHKVFNV